MADLPPPTPASLPLSSWPPLVSPLLFLSRIPSLFSLQVGTLRLMDGRGHIIFQARRLQSRWKQLTLT